MSQKYYITRLTKQGHADRPFRGFLKNGKLCFARRNETLWWDNPIMAFDSRKKALAAIEVINLINKTFHPRKKCSYTVRGWESRPRDIC